MSPGCFSWCPFPRKPATKKSVAKNESSLLEDEHRIPQVKIAAPGEAQYIKATAKEVLGVLQSAATLIPVPLLHDSIGLALKIIELCEEVSAVEQKIKALQERVGFLMVVVVENVTAKSEDGSAEMVVEAAKGIETDVKGLVITLGTINNDLGEISAKKRWELVFYKTANAETVDDCMNRLSTALERFKLASDLREYDVIQQVRGRLEKMAKTVDNIAIDVKDVSRKVNNLTENIQDIIQRSLAQTPIKASVCEEIPLKPEVFYGRDDMVKDIAQLLVKEETSRVCILGPGGMGKTSVSLAVAESPLVCNYFTRSPVWMPCIGATTKDLFLETLYLQLQVPGDKQATLEKIISELNMSTEPRLIIFDNFETPMLVSSGGTQKGVEDILRKLAELKHIALLVTMRGSRPPCDIAIQWQTKNIQPTDEAASLSIFHRIHPSSQKDPHVTKLMTVLGHMPFAVTLMANLARDTHSTAKELLALWAEAGPDILSGDQEQSINHSIKLSLESNLVKQNPDAIRLLSIVSLLPAGTTKENLIRWWAPKLKSSIATAIVTLMRAGLLVENKQQESDVSILFVIPVVQSFMQHQRVDDELRREVVLSCYHFVLSHACRWLDSSFPVNSKVLAGEDSNIQFILVDSTATQHAQLSNQYMDALIAYSWHRCDTMPTLDVVEYALSMARTHGQKKYVASALWCLGRTHYNIGTFTLSSEYLREAYQLFKAISPGDPELQYLGAQCGIDLTEVEEAVSKDLNEIIPMALEIESNCATMSESIHVRSLVNAGIVFSSAEREQEALVFLERATAIMKVAVEEIPIRAEACQIIGRIYRHLEWFPEAIDAMQEAWNLAEKSGSQKLQAEIAVEFGEFLISTNRIAEGWKYLEAALMTATIIGSRLDIALSLRNMGYAYLCQRDYKNAYGAFEAAYQKFRGDGTDWEVMCEFNMEAIEQKEKNPHLAIEFRRPFPVNGSWDFDPDNPVPLNQAEART